MLDIVSKYSIHSDPDNHCIRLGIHIGKDVITVPPQIRHIPSYYYPELPQTRHRASQRDKLQEYANSKGISTWSFHRFNIVLTWFQHSLSTASANHSSQITDRTGARASYLAAP